MTPEIKAAIAGAIEALEFYADGTKYFGIIKEVNGATVMEWPVYQDGGVKAIEALADIRRIEFAESRQMKPQICTECFVNLGDPIICPGCQAYKEHQQ